MSRTESIPDVHEVQARLKQWRQIRPKKGPIPGELWSAAAAFHPDGGKLTRQVAGSKPHHLGQPRPRAPGHQSPAKRTSRSTAR